MIAKLMKAVLDKHGPFTVFIDKMGRFNLQLINFDTGKTTQLGNPAFSIGSVLISALGEDKR